MESVLGQYWLAVNLDRKEFVHGHRLGSGLKLWEMVANAPGVGAALIILTAAHPEERGGGDLNHAALVGTNEQVIGRWAGNRIAIVGDYAEDGDIPSDRLRPGDPAISLIYGLCNRERDGQIDPETQDWLRKHNLSADSCFTDVSDLVARQIEVELEGKYVGSGWREFVRSGTDMSIALSPAQWMSITAALNVEGSATNVKLAESIRRSTQGFSQARISAGFTPD
jgi:hypothetical protein